MYRLENFCQVFRVSVAIYNDAIMKCNKSALKTLKTKLLKLRYFSRDQTMQEINQTSEQANRLD